MNIGESLLPVILTRSQWGPVGHLGGVGKGGHGFEELWGTSEPPSLAASTMG